MQTIAQPLPTCEREKALLGVIMALYKTRYPDEIERIDRGAWLWLHGHTAYEGGRWYCVSSDGNTTYDVRRTGGCSCPDAQRSPGGRCKHRWAVCVAKRIGRLLTEKPKLFEAYDQTPAGKRNGKGTALELWPGAVYLFMPEDKGDMRILAKFELYLREEI